MPCKNGGFDASVSGKGDCEERLVGISAIRRTIEDHNNFYFFRYRIHSSGHIKINTDGEEETGKSRMGRGDWVIDSHCCCLEHLTQ